MRLFISYARVDKPIVKDWIVSPLEAGSYTVWFDERLTAGQGWQQQLADAIQNTDALVYCMTPESIASEWCQWELAKAVELNKPVIPVLMQARTELPEYLQKLQNVDFTNGPIGDAVGRLIGGLQNLSTTQLPPAHMQPQGIPPQALETKDPVKPNMLLRILRDPAFAALLTVIGVILAVIALNQGSSNSGNAATPTQAALRPTPVTPCIAAQRNMDIREYPLTGSNRIAIVGTGECRDVIGISQDARWYQVLLPDGRLGWVVASTTDGVLTGSIGTIPVIVPTLTLTYTATITSTEVPPTHTVQPSPTTTQLPFTPTVLPPSAVPVLNSAPSATATLTSSPAVQATYPCVGTVTNPDSGASVINNVVYLEASTSSQPGNALRVGTQLTIQRYTQAENVRWYLIFSGSTRLGWVPVRYIRTDTKCPEID